MKTCLVLLLLALFMATAGPVAAARPIDVSVPPPDAPEPVVYLTFDVEGPGAPMVLMVLRAYGVHATMFLTGAWASANPSLVEQMVADGHSIGNHSFSHPRFTRLNARAAALQIKTAEQAIERASGGVSPRPRFRFPYGDGQHTRWTMDVVAREGYQAYFWTVDPQDWRGQRPNAIAEYVVSHADNGSVILLHPAAPGTPVALPYVIWGLRARGFRFGTL